MKEQEEKAIKEIIDFICDVYDEHSEEFVSELENSFKNSSIRNDQNV